MGHKIGLVFAASVVLLAITLPPALVGDSWDKKTILTAYEPILVPGKVLPPGKYVIKLVDSLANRHIVRIMNEQENEVFATFLAIPNYRLKPTEKTQFGWWETPAGNPTALRAWFYPGDNFGQEFAYPKGLSAKIARTAQEPVPTIEAETPEQLKSAPVTVTEKSGEEKPLVAEAYTPPAPAPEPVATAPAPAPAPAEVAPAPELPRTATPFPIIGLLGAAALFSGITLRALTSRR
jgi:hypothetical protein